MAPKLIFRQEYSKYKVNTYYYKNVIVITSYSRATPVLANSQGA